MKLNAEQLKALQLCTAKLDGEDGSHVMAFDPQNGSVRIVSRAAFEDGSVPDRIVPVATKDQSCHDKANINAILDKIALIEPDDPPFTNMFEISKIRWNESSIETYRRRKGLSEDQLALLTGMDVGKIQDLRYGDISDKISPEEALALARSLGVEVKDLIGA